MRDLGLCNSGDRAPIPKPGEPNRVVAQTVSLRFFDVGQDHQVTTLPYPSACNGFLSAHIHLLCTSYRCLTGRNLVDPDLDEREAARHLFEAPFVLLSHNAEADPILTYGNRTALDLFELDWDRLTRMPSRLTAEAPDREERARLLAEVAAKGYIDHYSGVRVSASGRRFLIEGAVVWNLIDQQGLYRGQAATFGSWRS
jgi:hypothetical protein